MIGFLACLLALSTPAGAQTHDRQRAAIIDALAIAGVRIHSITGIGTEVYAITGITVTFDRSNNPTIVIKSERLK